MSKIDFFSTKYKKIFSYIYHKQILHYVRESVQINFEKDGYVLAANF